MDNIKREINSVSDVLEVTNYLNSSNNTAKRYIESKMSRFFRGQSNYEWNLSPALYRIDPKTNESLFNREKVLIWEAMNKFPEEFEGLDKFSILVKLQHYGMKTRLLDLTENPLVALYFACNENPNKDGAFYIFDNTRTYFPQSLDVEYIMEYIFAFSGFPMNEAEAEKYFRKRFDLDSDSFSLADMSAMESLIHRLTLSGIAVSPKRNNPRLVAQQGAFYLFGMHLKDKITGYWEAKYFLFEPYDFSKNVEGEKEEDIKIGEDNYKLKIPKESKKIILNELNYLQINDATLFDDLEHKLKYIQGKVRHENIEIEGFVQEESENKE